MREDISALGLTFTVLQEVCIVPMKEEDLMDSITEFVAIISHERNVPLFAPRRLHVSRGPHDLEIQEHVISKHRLEQQRQLFGPRCICARCGNGQKTVFIRRVARVISTYSLFHYDKCLRSISLRTYSCMPSQYL